jgi:Zn-dependent membrane protease YugP
MFYAFDPLWLLFAVPGLFIGIWAQVKLSHAYGKYSKVAVESGMTGAQAAHESGHALQHQAVYGLFNFRMAIVPVTQFASMAYMGIFFAGFIFRQFFHQFILIAIVLFGIMTLFQLVTLPVEFDASRRAKEQLFRLGLVREDERTGISKVLDAAALTYVAALVSSVLNLLYLLTIARDGRR